jgi:hypothetical protein
VTPLADDTRYADDNTYTDDKKYANDNKYADDSTHVCGRQHTGVLTTTLTRAEDMTHISADTLTSIDSTGDKKEQ